MRRERIVAAAVLQGNEIDLAFLEALRSFEQHVFKKVRLAGMARFLIPRTNLVPDHRGDDGRGMRLLRQNDQAVLQDRPADLFNHKCRRTYKR